MNNILTEILPPETRELRGADAPRSLADWIEHTEFCIDARPFSFDRVPYLRSLYADDSRYMVIRKGTQVGMSTWSLARVLHGADQYAQRWIYFLPTDEETDDFVQDRVGGILQESDYLTDRVGRTDNIGLKHIGPGLVYFRGLWTKRRAKGVPADGLIFDEVDEHKPEMIAFGARRVLASDWQYKYYLSVPSFSGYGIDKLFADTDQHYFLHKCPACNRWSHFDEEFPANFLKIPKKKSRIFPAGATHYRGCPRCGTRLDVTAGVWVPKYRKVKKRGYHISRLYTLQCPPDYPNVATYLIDEFNEGSRSQTGLSSWTIEFRGLPFDGEGARITVALLDEIERSTGFEHSGTGAIMGVDQGDTLHVSLYRLVGSDSLQLLYCEATESWSRLDDLWRRYGCWAGAIDGKPNRTPAKEFCAYHKGCYVHDLAERDDLEPVTDTHRAKRKPKRGEVRQRKRRVKSLIYQASDGRIMQAPWFVSSRQETLERTVDFVEGGNLILPAQERLSGNDATYYQEYRQNLINLKYKREETPRGPRNVFLHNANHHGMGLNSARLVAFELGLRRPATGTLPVFLDWFKRGNA